MCIEGLGCLSNIPEDLQMVYMVHNSTGVAASTHVLLNNQSNLKIPYFGK